ncbi:hypothetical protein Agub_g12565 [Astrephomene gubernaculifera]|uniref:RRM domain-containing protein n=1 Tax=Astrephomene gubernaculifera TaxID=47775 RepID=A0AAD3DYG8_9CHLO|nr:hypothetical protein Agub_g12565 [Astrephomene gubernaculifera]
MLSGSLSAGWRLSGTEYRMHNTSLGVQVVGGVLQAQTLSSETLHSMYDPSTDRSRGVASETGSLHQQSSMLKNASDPSLRSTASSFADLESAGYARSGYQRQEEQDIFSAVGGMELGMDAELEAMGADAASTSGYEPHSEPSRTLFARHINPAASDEELLAMFKVFGDVRHVYTVSKHRGFVMVTYYDLRAAARAQAALNGIPLTGVPLDVHFCAPKGDQTANQGTVTVFNLDPDTSNDHLVWLFSKFGDVKDIRESPDRSNQKFITFYDTRHALAALRAMNKAEHLGKLPSNMPPPTASALSSQEALAGMEGAIQRGHLAAGHHGGSGGAVGGAWDSQQSVEALLQQAHLSAKGGNSTSRASSQAGTTSPSPLPGTSPAGAHFMVRARAGHQEAQVPPGLSVKFQHHPQGSMSASQHQHPHPVDPMAASAGLRTGGMHVSDSASSMSGVAGQAANQLLAAAAAAAAGRSPLGGGGMMGPHGAAAAAHLHKAVPSLATLSEAAQTLEGPAGLYAAAAAAAAAGSMMGGAQGGGAGGVEHRMGGSTADVNAAANMLMGLQLSAAASGGQAATPEQQLWALQQISASTGQSAAAAPGQAGMWAAAAAAGSLYGQAATQAAMPNAAAAAAAASANLQALRLQQELQARQAQQQLAVAANLASLQGQTLSAAELNAAAAQLLHIAGLGHALGPAPTASNAAAAAAAYLPPAAAAGLGVPAGNAGGLGNLGGAAAAQQLLQHAMAMGNVNALGALGSMQAAALGVQAGAHGAGRLGGSYGSLAGALSGAQGGHHHGAGGSRDAAGGAGSRGGGRLSRRTTDPAAELERKMQQEKLYALDAVKIRAGEDKRTTLMIKNIPNKYTQKMLLATIDEQFKGAYDFFYLPIDFKNKCNVGYAFINMINPLDIIPLVERFNNRRWERFNSEKVCSISYARIQGRAALVAHFQNSSLMHEDKRCRPILFTANGAETTDPEAFQNDSLQQSMQPSAAGSTASAAMATTGNPIAGLQSSATAVPAAAGAHMSGPARLRAAAAAAAAASGSVGQLPQ